MSLTPEQLAIRKLGIGGSEIAAVVGLSLYNTAIDSSREKTGQGKPFTNRHTERGNHMEKALLGWYTARTGRQVITTGTFTHPEFPICRATPDGIADGRVVEVKMPGWRVAHHWGEPGTDQIPDYYQPQVQWEMAASGMPITDMVAYLDDDIAIYTVEFNRKLFEAMLSRATKFWNDHVLTGVPPPVDGSKSYASYLKEQFPRALGDMAIINAGDVMEWIEKYRAARDRRLAAEKDEEKAKCYIEHAIGDKDGIDGEWGRIHYKNNKDSTVVNYKAIVEQLQPPAEVIAANTVTKPGPRVMRSKFTGEK